MPPLPSGLLGLLVGALLGTAALLSGLSGAAAVVAGVTGLCAVWWTLEPIPTPVTSLIPFAVLPFAGVLDGDACAAAFGHPLILLLMGGFLLSTVMERNGAHERLALAVIATMGGATGRRAVLGFMVACAAISMWASNTATTLMLLPVARAVVERSSDPKRLGMPLFLGLAWSASIGGVGTPIGTPPNPLLLAELAKRGTPWGFAEWMMVGVPVVVLLVPLTWLLLCRGGRLDGVIVPLAEPRPWQTHERRALYLFGLAIVLWVTRTVPGGGWGGVLGLDDVGDHTIALGMVVLAFVWPDGRGGPLLDWETASKIPWGLLLLFAGGIALGDAFRTSGLDQAIANSLSQLGDLPVPLMVLSIALVVIFVSEVASNTATAALLMPILGTAAVTAGDDPQLWLIPAGLAASTAFMLPVGTAPNAIVIGSGYVRTADMVREGFALNLIAACVITAVTLLRPS